jgi:hypothetical protein
VDVRIRAAYVNALVAALAAGGIACAKPPAEAAERLARTKQEGAEFGRALDHVEERLLANQAQVHFWQELGRRHQHVSAIACDNVNSHALEMAKNLELQKTRNRQLRPRRDPRPETVSAAPARERSSSNN